MRKIILFSSISTFFIVSTFFSCQEKNVETTEKILSSDSLIVIDTSKIPNSKFGKEVRYGRDLLLNTAYFIGPAGIKGKYLGNKMNCTNCHQDAGTKPFSFNLMSSHNNYPQYRGREGKVLSLAERVNNCIMRPHNGKPLPLDSREMIAILSYLKWINSFAPKDNHFKGEKNLEIIFPKYAADTKRGEGLYNQECSRCHGQNGEGVMNVNGITYQYPPLWGNEGYQPGSSMHRIIKQAQWLKSNMPHDKATWEKPYLSDEQALDIAAFVNDDNLHKRPNPKSFDYPNIIEKAIDYSEGLFIDTFSVHQHKNGPFQPIIDYWLSKGLKPIY
jgi:thiosulfate dehydrogenase